jgi:hypothetical protein
VGLKPHSLYLEISMGIGFSFVPVYFFI